MSYGSSQNVTPISELPDLDDLEMEEGYGGQYGGGQQGGGGNYSTVDTYSGAQMLPPDQASRFGKLIRKNHEVPAEAGMDPYSHHHQPIHHIHEPMLPVEQQDNQLTTYNMPNNTPTCIDVATHIANCPICSKFYNNDKTMYVIAIIVLSIMCILLLKKVLDI